MRFKKMIKGLLLMAVVFVSIRAGTMSVEAADNTYAVLLQYDGSNHYYEYNLDSSTHISSVNKKLMQLANADGSTYSNDTVTAIKFVDEPFTSSVNLASTVVNKSYVEKQKDVVSKYDKVYIGSTKNLLPVYARLNGTTIELYTQAKNVYINPLEEDLLERFHSLEVVDLGKVNTIHCRTMKCWFSEDEKLALDKIHISWNTSEVIDISQMFNECFKEVECLDFSDFDFSNVQKADTFVNITRFNEHVQSIKLPGMKRQFPLVSIKTVDGEKQYGMFYSYGGYYICDYDGTSDVSYGDFDTFSNADGKPHEYTRFGYVSVHNASGRKITETKEVYGRIGSDLIYSLNDCEILHPIIRTSQSDSTYSEYVSDWIPKDGEWYFKDSTSVTSKSCITGHEINPSDFVISTDHDYEWVVDIEPTYTEPGEKHYECTRCHKVVNEHTKIDVIQHDCEYGNWVTVKEPTYTETGLKRRECKLCHSVTYDSIDKIPHEHSYTGGEWVIVKEPTCTEYGEKRLYCTICNKAYYTVKISPEHVCNDWTLSKEPTCNTKGTLEGLCIRCGEKVTKKTDSYGEHNYEWKTLHEPTCYSSGLKRHYCTVCGIVDEDTTIEKLDHDYQWIVDKEPTCEPGRKYQKCTLCGSVANYINIDPIQEHDWHESTKDGIKGQKCSICGKFEEEEPHIALKIIEMPTEDTYGSAEITCDNQPRMADLYNSFFSNIKLVLNFIPNGEVPENCEHEKMEQEGGELYILVQKMPTTEESGLGEVMCPDCGYTMGLEDAKFEILPLEVKANYKVQLPASIDLKYVNDPEFAKCDCGAFVSEYEMDVTGDLRGGELTISTEDVTLTDASTGGTVVATHDIVPASGKEYTTNLENGEEKVAGRIFIDNKVGVPVGNYTGTANYTFHLEAPEEYNGDIIYNGGKKIKSIEYDDATNKLYINLDQASKWSEWNGKKYVDYDTSNQTEIFLIGGLEVGPKSIKEPLIAFVDNGRLEIDCNYYAENHIPHIKEAANGELEFVDYEEKTTSTADGVEATTYSENITPFSKIERDQVQAMIIPVIYKDEKCTSTDKIMSTLLKSSETEAMKHLIGYDEAQKNMISYYGDKSIFIEHKIIYTGDAHISSVEYDEVTNKLYVNMEGSMKWSRWNGTEYVDYDTSNDTEFFACSVLFQSSSATEPDTITALGELRDSRIEIDLNKHDETPDNSYIKRDENDELVLVSVSSENQEKSIKIADYDKGVALEWFPCLVRHKKLDSLIELMNDENNDNISKADIIYGIDMDNMTTELFASIMYPIDKDIFLKSLVSTDNPEPVPSSDDSNQQIDEPKSNVTETTDTKEYVITTDDSSTSAESNTAENTTDQTSEQIEKP